MAYIIVCKENEELAWSNSWGWGTEDFDTFTYEERETLSLPLEGVWREVMWRVGDETT